MKFSYAKPIRLLKESRPQIDSTLVQYDKRKGEGGRGKEKGEGGRGKEKGGGRKGEEKGKGGRGKRKGREEGGKRKGREEGGKRKGEGGRGKRKGREEGERERGRRKGKEKHREREGGKRHETHARSYPARTHVHTRTRRVLETKINKANKLFYLMLSLSGSKLALFLGRCSCLYV